VSGCEAKVTSPPAAFSISVSMGTVQGAGPSFAIRCDLHGCSIGIDCERTSVESQASKIQ
jgi:hypothetical protein